jgi:transposase
MHQGAGKVKADLPKALTSDENDLTPAMRKLLASLFDDVRQHQRRAGHGPATHYEAIAAADDVAWRLMTIPGIGPLAATALLAACRQGRTV